MNKITEQAILITKYVIMNIYNSGSMDDILPYFASDAEWLDNSQSGIVSGIPDIVQKLTTLKETIDWNAFLVNELNHRIIVDKESTCVIMSQITLLNQDSVTQTADQHVHRIVFTFQIREGAPEIVLLQSCASDYAENYRDSLRLQITMQNSGSYIFEYDVKSDTFSYYRPARDPASEGFEKIIIPEYKKVAYLKGGIHPHDQLRMVRGILTGAENVMELRLRFSEEEPDLYNWWRFDSRSIQEKGRLVSVIGTMQNIHRIKELEGNRDRLESLVNKIIRDDFEAICLVNTDTSRYRVYMEVHTKDYSIPDSGIFEINAEFLCENFVYEMDRASYLKAMNLEHIVEELERGQQEYTVNFRMFKNKNVDEPDNITWKSVKFSYLDQKKKTLLMRLQDISELGIWKKKQEELTVLEQQKFNFLLESMCRNFMEVEVDTGYSKLTDPWEGTTSIGLFSDQINYFTENLVIEEEREKYLEEYDLNNLIANIKNNNNLYTVYCRVRYEDGIHYLLINNTLIRGENNRNYVFLYAQDITDLKTKDERASQELKDALLIAQLANAAKSDFLSRMSHEIRTPMNAIIGMTTIALANSADPKRVIDCLSKIGVSARFLLALINDILDMSRIESGKMLLSSVEFNFSEWVKGLLAIVVPQAESREITFQAVAEGLTETAYIGDALRLRQIIINILTNALKFTSSGGIVRFCIRQVQKTDGRAVMRFTISDTGIGMSKEFLERMFDPFEQADSNISLQYGGTGLGLAICKNLAALMDGKITVNSIPNVGSEFVIEVKLGLCQSSVSQNGHAMAAEYGNIRLLIVDDDIFTCEHTKLILEEMGLSADWVASGEEAVEKAAQYVETEYAYDVILIEYRMVGVNGLDIVRELRQLKGKAASLVLMSVYDMNDIEEEAKRAGVSGFLCKPLFCSTLSDALQQASGWVINEEGSCDYVEVFDFSGKRVLLVEDNELNVEIARCLLEMKNFEVETAENGLIALNKFLQTPVGYYDAILMDIRMPVMDGLSAAKNIRMLDKSDSQTVPIIAMTANAFEEDIRKSRLAGMNAHLAKPIDTEQMYGVLKELLMI